MKKDGFLRPKGEIAVVEPAADDDGEPSRRTPSDGEPFLNALQYTFRSPYYYAVPVEGKDHP